MKQGFSCPEGGKFMSAERRRKRASDTGQFSYQRTILDNILRQNPESNESLE
jgi:hypothetical protein